MQQNQTNFKDALTAKSAHCLLDFWEGMRSVNLQRIKNQHIRKHEYTPPPKFRGGSVHFQLNADTLCPDADEIAKDQLIT